MPFEKNPKLSNVTGPSIKQMVGIFFFLSFFLRKRMHLYWNRVVQMDVDSCGLLETRGFTGRTKSENSDLLMQGKLVFSFVVK